MNFLLLILASSVTVYIGFRFTKKFYKKGRFEGYEEFKIYLATEIIKGFGRIPESQDFITYIALLEITRSWDKMEDEKY